MIIDCFKDRKFWQELEKYNQDILEVCNNWKYAASGTGYDFKEKKVSCWFDPKKLRKIYIPNSYPNTVPLTYDPKFNLTLYCCNYPTLFVINKLYADRKDILIEDVGSGIARFSFYLSKGGFTNFSFIDDFSQTAQPMFEELMKKGNMNYILNDYKSQPIISNQVGLPWVVKPIADSIELYCYYNNTHSRETVIEPKMKEKGLVFLCRDSDDLMYFYCKKEKYKEFKKQLKPYEILKSPESERGTIPQYEPSFDEYEQEAMNKYMKSGAWLTENKKTEELENKLKEFLGVKHCIMVNNGTISLSLALLAVGVKPGDEVIVPDLTMIATINAVKLLGAKPVVVDVLQSSLTLNPTNINRSPKLKAIIYVSLNGRWDMTGKIGQLIDWCKLNNVAIIEDAAQSLGSQSYRSKIGNDPEIDFTSFSFSPAKIITTGQGGCLTTNNDELAKKVRRLKNYGRLKGGHDNYEYFGINAKFTDMQAVIGLAQMRKLDYRIGRKKEIYGLYYQSLKDISYIEFIPTKLAYTTPWFVDIYSKYRNGLMTYLELKKIKTRKIYPPIHAQQSCKDDIISGARFPISDKYSAEGLWLPSAITLTNEDINYICEKIKEYFKCQNLLGN